MKASCSSLRCSVASAVALSNEAIPSSNDLISAFKFEIASLLLLIVCARFDKVCFRVFTLSSPLSNSALQYSRLESSSSCSFFKASFISSTILITFSKPFFLFAKVRLIKSRCGFPAAASILFNTANALERTCLSDTATCRRLGNVFLNRSRASSSLRILIVSEIANNSSDRVCLISWYSLTLSSQSCPNCARYPSSAAKDFSVSSLSSFI
mmetsp:Transcript_24982/g.54906  ORF Transcript_24982/g.54906 Transcript_24982/m.54906 type:complete len:211 (-) Transcript_24982:832-1464(-)